MAFKDLKGQKFNRLLVLEQVPNTKVTYWQCLCDCGSEVKVRTCDLISGKRKSCGCHRKDEVIEREAKYGSKIKSLPGEIWKPIPQTNGLYLISNKGRLKSVERVTKAPKGATRIHKEIIRKLVLNSNGYYSINILIDQKLQTFRVHRLMAEAFIPNPENKEQVNHINGIKDDNRLENLEWSTRSENALHSYRVIGNKVTPLRGEMNGNAKLTAEDVLEIRRVHSITKNATEIARRYGVHHSLISNIVNGKLWKHLK